MPRNTVQPNAWVALKLPNGNARILQITPSTTVSLGKYGSFPSNLLIERPYHLTYEIQDKRDDENFSRLRVVPGTELNADALVDTTAEDETTTATPETEPANQDNSGSGNGEVVDSEAMIAAAVGEELALADEDAAAVATTAEGSNGNGAVAVITRKTFDEQARQTLTTEEIEELKRKGAGAGREIVAKLLLRHTAIDQKTAYSLAKYKLLKEKKYVRRFTVLPLDVPMLAQWMLEDKDASKILELRQEALALIGCWADVHFGGMPLEGATTPHGGRWLAVDDTGGLLVAAMAERMGILYRDEDQTDSTDDQTEQIPTQDPAATENANGSGDAISTTRASRKRPHKDDLAPHYALTNTITLIHANSQPNLSLLRYFDFDASDPNPQEAHHPLATHLLPVSWLQVLSPSDDPTYAERPAEVTLEELQSWKTNRRGNYHRKRRRWARAQQIVDGTRAGGFAGLAVASTMDPVSVLRHALPLLAGGSPLAVYSPTVEPLTQLADCFSIGRRGAWVAAPPPEVEGRSQAELDAWPGSPEFPINPTLLVGVSVQTTRAKRWQVLPGRTHPLMMGKGGAEGYLLTGWRAIPAEGRISARGKFQKRR
ncbi:tRNA (adenine-N(1)-)-methyltransferase non-catalytic subunit trm6 [Cordyceps fumosorosea ARSEF 2679]|uniref:tRNA (adenine(58)-N(1))-methyltransferase non-catalytic subunit TRM6 n=1 Tax=Cordyceps fumosorosea (strain ARSEF 2679) TaxID=1081104 RepID=A0A167LBE3_CORFA|nr:tRNA (adenine-N(1)-)-methyltransferase non-catalytic subunit trm6 [Cordyceps fumosorosea ARSEF 2679]OAA52882.1 tRNA (adenine-N(1)-)-methyltransferase non-catalytic subunit trm6 [Cordyceps fumosorosea ARSEF 2679]